MLDLEYRKARLVNIALLLTFFYCSYFTLWHFIFMKDIYISIVEILTSLIALVVLIYFHKTNNVENSAVFAVTLSTIAIIAYLFFARNQTYALIWISVIPPLTYFLLDRKTANLFSVIFCIYMSVFILTNYKNWEPAIFDFKSYLNVGGAIIALITFVRYFELSRVDAVAVLENKSKELKESRDQLHLILNSTAESIFGINVNGVFTFCNMSCVNTLKYESQEEILGKEIKNILKHNNTDSKNKENKCKIIEAISKGEYIHLAGETFYKSNGDAFLAEYSAFPEYKDGVIVGAVVSFRDITEEQIAEEKIKYLSTHDALTGLYNRSYLDLNINNIDIAENYPISIIFGDLNGLKMTNDIYGHSSGDCFINKTAAILTKFSNPDDTIYRIGGDEFIVVMCKTDSQRPNVYMKQVKDELAKCNIKAIKCSISMGCDTKFDNTKTFETTMDNAENNMYTEKTKEHKSDGITIINNIMNNLYERSPREKIHSETVGELCEKIAIAMKLSESDIKKAKDAGILHDIGKIVLKDDVLINNGILNEEDKDKIHQHSIIGYRVLTLFNNTLDLAEGIYGHHENFNGSGYPKGLQGNEIPLLSRIIAVAEAYDSYTNLLSDSRLNKNEAVEKIKAFANIKYDPKVIDALVIAVDET